VILTTNKLYENGSCGSRFSVPVWPCAALIVQ
jgi:hypothetical protein